MTALMSLAIPWVTASELFQAWEICKAFMAQHCPTVKAEEKIKARDFKPHATNDSSKLPFFLKWQVHLTVNMFGGKVQMHSLNQTICSSLTEQ